MDSIIHITVNGQAYSVSIDPGEKLVDVLRKRLHLTGTKVGCGEGQCGTCTVLLDGRPVKSCLFPAEKADGKTILTIEGLAEVVNGVRKLHPLQRAFVDYGAVQCGFCTPGQIMASYALLVNNPNPSSDDIQKALKRNLCRCGSYPSIEKAIQAAAKSLRTGEPVHPPEVTNSVHPGRVIGRMEIRPDAEDKVTGEAVFTDDLNFRGDALRQGQKGTGASWDFDEVGCEPGPGVPRGGGRPDGGRYPRFACARAGISGLASDGSSWGAGQL